MIRMLGGLVGCQDERRAARRPARSEISNASASRPRAFRAPQNLLRRVGRPADLRDPVGRGARRRSPAASRSFRSSPTRGLARDRIVDPAEVARRDPEVDLRVVVRKEGAASDDPWTARMDRTSSAVRARPDLRGEVDLHPAAGPGEPDRGRPPDPRAPGAHSRARRRSRDRAAGATAGR